MELVVFKKDVETNGPYLKKASKNKFAATPDTAYIFLYLASLNSIE
jgi:hypothetical protein